MHKNNKIKAIVAIAVALAFIMPVTVVANFGTIGITSDVEDTGDMEIMVESTNSDNGVILPATGKIWYVGSGPGNDSTTIQGGVNLAGAGDTVYVYDGIYPELITINKQLDLIGESRENTIISPSGTGWNKVIYVYKSGGLSGVNVSNFTVKGLQGYGIYYNLVTGGTIKNCNVSQRKQGIYLQKAVGTSVINCTVYRSTDDREDGIMLQWSDGCNIEGCDVYNNEWNGIYIDSNSHSNTITNCTTHGNVRSGIFIDGKYGVPLNNKIIGCDTYSNGYGVSGGCGISIYQSSNCKLEDNTMHDNYCDFKVAGSSVSYYDHDIGPSNLINGEPIYWLLGIENEILDGIDFGFLGLISCTDVTVNNADTYGVLLVNTTYSTISNVNSYNNEDGIFLNLASSNNDIINCNTYNCSGHGIKLLYGSSYNNITNCNTYDSWNSGIYLYNNVNNVIIKNCNTSGATYGSGIYITGASENTLINCHTYDNSVGVTVYGGSGAAAIWNNSIVDCDVYNNKRGIYNWHSTDGTVVKTTITGCKIYNNGGDGGIYIYRASGNTVTNNNIYDNDGYGIWIYSSSNNVLRDNTLLNNANGFGITGTISINYFYQDIDGTNTVDGKRIWYLVDHHDEIVDGSKNIAYIGLVSCTNILVTNANVGGAVLAGTTGSTLTHVTSHNSMDGIYLWGSSDNIIVECEVYDNGDNGIHFRDSPNNDIIHCKTYNNPKNGIFLEYASNNNNIESCDSYNNGYGIKFEGSGVSGNTITDCNLYDNSNGLYFGNSANNVITNCDIYHHADRALWLSGASTGNTITDCNVYDNNYAIYLASSTTKNNKFYHNNFANNVNFKDILPNTFDNGYPSGGNYWFNYAGVDLFNGPNQDIPGSDGIGDTPYALPNNVDHYPFMKPIGDITPPVIKNVALTTSDPLDTIAPYGWEKVTCTIIDFEVDKAKLVVTNPDTTITEYTMSKIGYRSYSCEITLTDAGDYTYYIWANDTSSNNATSPSEQFELPPNWDVDMNGQTYFNDLMSVIWMYGDTDSNGWVREDIDNNGQVYFNDLMNVVWHYTEWWK